MALTRKLLKSMGLDDEHIESIIEAHTETVNALKTERDDLKDKADRVEALEKELKDAKELAEKSEKDPYKVKYEALKEEFDGYKKDITTRETKTAKESAYRNLLKESGISEKRIDAILKVTDLESVELTEDGKIKDADERGKAIKDEWSDFIVSESVRGANTSQPPMTTPAKKTKEEIMDIKDPSERRLEIAKNLTLFN